jgi:hypothetical protein
LTAPTLDSRGGRRYAHCMRALWERWVRTLLSPVDGASLGIFRIVFGALVAIDAMRFIFRGKVVEHFLEPTIHFTYLYLDFVRPWPGAWMYVHMWALAFFAALVSLGIFYQPAIVLLCLAYAHFFLIEQSLYMNHYYLILLISFLLIWIPADRVCALRGRRGPPTVPWWTILVLRFQLFVVYSYGAVAKLNADWLRGEPVYYVLTSGQVDVPSIASYFPPALLAYGIAYGGLFTDLAIPFLLSFRRTRLIGFGLAFVFHLLNEIFLNIGIFSYLAVGAITIFFDPDWPRRFIRGPAPRTPPVRARMPPSGSNRAWPLLAGLHLYALVQIVVPFRHLLFPGTVSWTEEGHRFSWHMKLRLKRSTVLIHVTDPKTGRRWRINPVMDLQPRQLRKLKTFPDIMLQYVHHHRDRLRERGIDPIITVDWQCSLNGRPTQPLIDATVNLAAVERSWRPAAWIIPLNPLDGKD